MPLVLEPPQQQKLDEGNTAFWFWLHKLWRRSTQNGEVDVEQLYFDATQRVAGRNTAGAGAGEEVTATQLLDWISATNGRILVRLSGVWTTSANLTFNGTTFAVIGAVTMTHSSTNLILARSSGGDTIHMTGIAAGGGAQIAVWNSGTTDFEPLDIFFETLTLKARNGVGSTIDIASITSSGISSTGLIKSSSASAGIGYATGAGGTVTQGAGSGKATGVTLNKITGEITMDGAALAADTMVSFILTNSAIAAGDYVAIQHISAGTQAAYNCTALAAAGSATVNVRNVTPGSLSEAIVLKFVVIKAVTS